MRFYPVVRDALSIIRLPVERANFHFECSDPLVSDLADHLLRSQIRELFQSLARGALEFGHQVVEVRWEPRWNVQVRGAGPDRDYPFAWAVRRFAAFDPSDTRLLIDPRTGDFAGVRQFVGGGQEVPASKCLLFVNDKEFDSNYGVPRTKAAIPFVAIAESVYDDMAQYSRSFAVPWKIGRYQPGGTSDEEGNVIDNGAVMLEQMSGMGSGSDVVLPSTFSKDSPNYLWDVDIKSVQGEDRYVEKLDHLNSVIRMAMVVPEMASSSSPDTGTYNLGETQIELFLANIESILEGLANVLNAGLLGQFVDYNFGPSAPRCRIVMEPLDVKVRRMLLKGLVDLLTQGVPVEDRDGQELRADWQQIAGESGVPLYVVDARSQARDLVREAREQMARMSEEVSLAYDESKHKRGGDPENRGRWSKQEGSGHSFGDVEGLSKQMSSPARMKSEAYTHAQEAYPQFKATSKNIADTLGIPFFDGSAPEGWQAAKKATGPRVVVAPLKAEERAEAKVEGDYDGDWGQIGDIVRASVVVDNLDDIQTVLDLLLTTGEWKLARLPKDRIRKPTDAGYRDILVNLQAPNGHIVEIQITHSAMMEAKKVAHSLYEEETQIARAAAKGNRKITTEERARRNFLRKEQNRIYAAAWLAATGQTRRGGLV